MQERRLEVFLAVAMSRTFGKAADMLNVTPSSVSRELKNLEEELGMLLVDRQKGVKAVKLTPAGESLLPLVFKWQEAKKELASLCRGQSAFFLSLAGCEVANNHLLSELFVKLLGHNPPVHLRIETNPTDMLYEKVESREVDAAFVVHQEPSRFVKIDPLYKDTMKVVMYGGDRGKFEIEGNLVDPEDLDPAHELYIEWSTEFRLWHNKIWNPTIGIPAQLLSPHLVPKLMTTPGQWVILPCCALHHFEQYGKKVRWYDMTTRPPFLTFYKLTHRNPKMSALKGLEILEKVLDEMNIRNI